VQFVFPFWEILDLLPGFPPGEALPLSGRSPNDISILRSANLSRTNTPPRWIVVEDCRYQRLGYRQIYTLCAGGLARLVHYRRVLLRPKHRGLLLPTPRGDFLGSLHPSVSYQITLLLTLAPFTRRFRSLSHSSCQCHRQPLTVDFPSRPCVLCNTRPCY